MPRNTQHVTPGRLLSGAAPNLTFTDVPVGEYILQVELPSGQSAVNLPILTVTVSDGAPVTVAPAPLQVQHRIYLPSVQR